MSFVYFRSLAVFGGVVNLYQIFYTFSEFVMSMGAEIRIELLRALYSSFGELLAWTQLHESLETSPIPSPHLFVPWMRTFIHLIEEDLANLLNDDEARNFMELHFMLCCQRYRFIRALLECIFHM